MRTTDIFGHNKAQKLNETFEKTFGKRLALETFTVAQLEDARNRLRTQVSQVRDGSGFNETIENEALTQAQWMLDSINAELAERFEQTAIHSTDVATEGFGSLEEKVQELLQKFEQNAMEIGGYGDPDITEIVKHLENGDAESAAEVVWYAYSDQDGGEFPQKEALIDDLQADFEELAQGGDNDNEGGETDDGYALASAGHGSDEDYGSYESQTQGNDMTSIRESAADKAGAVVVAKDMTDKVGRWIEELSGMENDTLLNLGDTIRDEMGQEQAKAYLEVVAPAIQQALAGLKMTRETLAGGMRSLTGEEQSAEVIGAEPAGEEPGIEAAGPDELNAGGELPPEPGAEDDAFAASEPATGGLEAAGREQRESIDFQNRLLSVLAG